MTVECFAVFQFDQLEHEVNQNHGLSERICVGLSVLPLVYFARHSEAIVVAEKTWTSAQSIDEYEGYPTMTEFRQE